MNENRNRIRRAAFFAILGAGLAFAGATRAFGADPVIHVTWTDTPGPSEGSDYTVSTSSPASVDFPDVKLITGSLTWKIWSTDSDNPNNIGDIGNITSPYAQNFTVTIENDSSGAGARDVKGIDLDPTDASKYSSLNGGITGDLAQKLFLQKSSGGTGGVASFTIAGDVLGDMTIPAVDSVYVYGDVAEGVTITVGGMVGDKQLYFQGAEFSGTLLFPNGLDDLYATVTIYTLLSSTGVVDFNDQDLGCWLILGYGASAYSVVTAGTMNGTMTVNDDFAGTATFDTVSGSIEFEGGDLTGTISTLGDWSGQLYMLAGGVDTTGAVDIGGDLTETAQMILVELEGIGGDLAGDLTISGEVGGGITIGGDADADINLGELTGTMTIAGDFLPSGYYFAADDISGSLSVGGNAYGHVDVQQFTGSISVTGDVDFSWFINWTGGSGDITGGALTSAAVVLAYGSGNTYSGTATFASVASDGLVETLLATLSGTIHVTGNVAGTVRAWGSGSDPGVTATGVIDIDGNVPGHVTVLKDALGNVDIGGSITSTGEVYVEEDLSGDLTVSGDADGSIEIDGEVSATGEIVADGDITGDVTITGEFNGNICGDNLSPMEELPENITITDFGDDGLICGARPGCGDGTISSSDPEDGTEDARQPHPPTDCSLEARQGIGSEEEPIVITLSEGGANNLACWELCETGIEEVDTGEDCSTLSANAIKSLTETSTGVYEIVLDRPISAGHWTSISYLGDDTYVTYASLPADSNADEYSGSSDILAHINCCLNQQCTPPYGDYSCDIDHSGTVSSADYLRLIDLLNGTDTFIVWLGETLPDNTCPGEGKGMGSGGSGSSEEDNAAFIDGFVEYLSKVTISGPEEEAELEQIVEALTGFCVDNFSSEERKSLADKLQDPELEFASKAAGEMVPDIVEALLE